MKLSHILVPALILSMFAGCDEKRRRKKHDDPASACDAICECEACTDAELEACQAQEQATEDQASQAGCDDELDAYLECAAESGECVNGQYGAVGCDDELAAYATCGGSGCPTANDGTCDEPEGTGTCAEGTDPIDCGGGTCATTNNGVCDEPEGTGTCAEGTDVADCSGPQSCDSMGVCGDFQSGCIACAVESTCSLQYNTCVNSQTCLEYNNCINACSDQACYDMCDSQYPTGSAQFNDAANCVLCDACPISCDGANPAC